MRQQATNSERIFQDCGRQHVVVSRALSACVAALSFYGRYSEKQCTLGPRPVCLAHYCGSFGHGSLVGNYGMLGCESALPLGVGDSVAMLSH